MSHLRDDELEQWRDEGNPADRERVLGHLATCDECRERLADLVRKAPAAAASSFDPAPFIARGQAAFRPSARRTLAWWLGLGGLAAAAASLLLVSRLTTVPNQPIEIRSSELQALAPVGTVQSVSEFRWASPFAATRYRVVVRNSAGTVVLQVDADEERARVPAESSTNLTPGVFQWTVDALDATGAVIASTKPQTFTIAR